MKRIIDENFSSFVNQELLALPTYPKCSKRMSFSFRWQDIDGSLQENIFAYATLMSCNMIREGRGCRILDYFNRDSLADEKFFNRIELIAKIWLNKGKSFDYLWFYLKDINGVKANSLITNIKGFEYIPKAKAYVKILKNKNTPE